MSVAGVLGCERRRLFTESGLEAVLVVGGRSRGELSGGAGDDEGVRGRPSRFTRLPAEQAVNRAAEANLKAAEAGVWSRELETLISRNPGWSPREATGARL